MAEREKYKPNKVPDAEANHTFKAMEQFRKSILMHEQSLQGFNLGERVKSNVPPMNRVNGLGLSTDSYKLMDLKEKAKSWQSPGISGWPAGSVNSYRVPSQVTKNTTPQLERKEWTDDKKKERNKALATTFKTVISGLGKIKDGIPKKVYPLATESHKALRLEKIGKYSGLISEGISKGIFLNDLITKPDKVKTVAEFLGGKVVGRALGAFLGTVAGPGGLIAGIVIGEQVGRYIAGGAVDLGRNAINKIKNNELTSPLKVNSSELMIQNHDYNSVSNFSSYPKNTSNNANVTNNLSVKVNVNSNADTGNIANEVADKIAREVSKTMQNREYVYGFA